MKSKFYTEEELQDALRLEAQAEEAFLAHRDEATLVAIDLANEAKVDAYVQGLECPSFDPDYEFGTLTSSSSDEDEEKLPF